MGIIKNNISKDDIIKKDVTITIDGKENKLTEYCYSLEGEKLNNFVINILTEMEKNQEIVNILKVKENGEEIGTVKIMEENDEYTFIIDSIDNTKSITLKYRNEKVNEKENNINLEVGIVSDGVSMGIIKFNQNTKVVDKLEEFDYSNAIDVNELTEEDTNELLTNLQEQLGDSVLYTLIIGYSNQFDASNYSSMY